MHPVAPGIESFDDVELAELMPVPVTIVALLPGKLGRKIASLLFARMTPDGVNAATREIEMPTRLIVARP